MKFRVLILLVFVFFTGCEILEEFDYIVVNATGTVSVGTFDFNNNKWGDPVNGEAVEMSLIKDGGERVDDTGTTGGNAGETTIHAVFNLYKEQPIDFKAKLVSDPMVIGSDRVGWDYVKKNARSGGKNKPDVCNVDLFIVLKVPVE